MSTELWFHKTDKFHNIASKAAVLTGLYVKEHGTSSDFSTGAWWSFLNKIHSASPENT